MRLFQRINGVWYVEIRRNEKISLQTTDEREAKVRFNQLQREALKGKLVVMDRGENKTLSEFIAEYEKWAEKNLSYNTSIKLRLKKFVDVIGKNREISTLKKRELDSYVDYCRGRKNKPTTINIELRHIKAAFSKAVEWEYLKENPFMGYSQLKYHHEHIRFLKSNEIDKIFNAIGDNQRDRLVFALYVYTGGRREEINQLQWSDIRDGCIHFKRKHYKVTAIPVHHILQAIIDELPPNRVGRVITGISAPEMARKVKSYLNQCGLGQFRCHDLRHTFASHLVMAGVDITTVSKLLGHTSISTTQIYAHLSNKHLQDAIAKLDY
ncbi:MAG: tyrosine-type recombinase/integrase [Nitrospirae bacterium]|nr:tyrosine-type recombinase/integrase [Nitrospirota bacterium]